MPLKIRTAPTVHRPVSSLREAGTDQSASEGYSDEGLDTTGEARGYEKNADTECAPRTDVPRGARPAHPTPAIWLPRRRRQVIR